MIIRTENLTKVYGFSQLFRKRIQAVWDLAINVNRGDIYGFLGPNGAGKTTTVRLFLRLIRPTKGKIWMFEKELRRRYLDILGRVGAIIETPAFYPYLSGYENLLVFAYHGLKKVDRRKIISLLEMVGLAERMHYTVNTYSLGMKQRLALALSLLSDPELVILDEPTNGLDPQGIIDVRNFIRTMNKEKGITFFISSHQLFEMEQVCTRVGIINKGKLVVEENLDKLLEGDSKRFKIVIDNPQKTKSILEEVFKIQTTSTDSNFLKIECEKDLIPQINKKLIEEGIKVFEITPIRMSLEEIFISRVGKQLV